MSEPLVVPVAEGGIRLGQFLKLADLIESGAEAKGFVAEGLVLVNGEIETRRGRQLVVGDLVEVTGVGSQQRSARVG
ncbi:RNA-binding S4 domain-containing protein [Auraticoccus monumenti]|uniref:Ribosome-associated protein n=1 Tax=Auraticoccus monumenti TaxID=675864 RepID=A0A1G7EXT4_9ACTN|nr:RNA-binding S4 domain-containing protein [Auraticoccus monumenti]SDE68471.1 ribosome-associated protein [Auraticoccus monumenti]